MSAWIVALVISQTPPQPSDTDPLAAYKQDRLELCLELADSDGNLLPASRLDFATSRPCRGEPLEEISWKVFYTDIGRQDLAEKRWSRGPAIGGGVAVLMGGMVLSGALLFRAILQRADGKEGSFALPLVAFGGTLGGAFGVGALLWPDDHDPEVLA